MSADLLVNMVEIIRDRQPNWDRAKEYLDSLTEDDYAHIMAEHGGEDLETIAQEDLEDYKDGARERCLEALESCKLGWDGQKTLIVKLPLAATDALIASEVSYGDVGEDLDNVALFIISGAACAAGFLAHENYKENVACWLPRSVAQQIVDDHAAYVAHGLKEPTGRVGQLSWAEAHQSMEDDLVPHLVDVADALETAGLRPNSPQDEDEEDEDDE